MDRNEALAQLRSLHAEIHGRIERQRHLQEAMPLHVQPASVNYAKDASRLEGEYNRLCEALQDQGLVSGADLDAAGLPARYNPRDPLAHVDGHIQGDGAPAEPGE